MPRDVRDATLIFDDEGRLVRLGAQSCPVDATYTRASRGEAHYHAPRMAGSINVAGATAPPWTPTGAAA
jgi:hypothetical protein